MIKRDTTLCVHCQKRPIYKRDLCKVCLANDFRQAMEFARESENGDYEFAVCECCGSSLDELYDCRNTSCGCSPYQGEDWY